jgi:hypothetical protein
MPILPNKKKKTKNNSMELFINMTRLVSWDEGMSVSRHINLNGGQSRTHTELKKKKVKKMK